MLKLAQSSRTASLFCKSRVAALPGSLRTQLQVRNDAPKIFIKIFASTYDNFIQTAGIRDGASTAPSFSQGFMIILTPPMLLTHVIIKIDISNAFHTVCRALKLDLLSGYASRACACGLKHKKVICPLARKWRFT